MQKTDDVMNSMDAVQTMSYQSVDGKNNEFPETAL